MFSNGTREVPWGLREGEYQTLSKDLFIQKPLSIKDLRKEIHKRIGLK
jgi:hypothetical protein